VLLLLLLVRFLGLALSVGASKRACDHAGDMHLRWDRAYVYLTCRDERLGGQLSCHRKQPRRGDSLVGIIPFFWYYYTHTHTHAWKGNFTEAGEI
jgi:hypothetical protein